MESNLIKKRQQFKVSIRRKEIQNYMKSRRVEMLRIQEQGQLTTQQEERFWNIINLTTLPSLSQFSSSQLEEHLQMLIEILHLDDRKKISGSMESTLKILIDFYYELQSHWSRKIKLYIAKEQSMIEDGAQKLVIVNQIFNLVPVMKFIEFIGVTYFYIVPQNIFLLKKIVSILNDVLLFATKTFAEMQQNLQACGISPQQAICLDHAKKNILITLMNITYSEDPVVLNIVLDEGIVTEIAYYIEERGFSELEKESVAGIYSNMIEYLCSVMRDKKHENLQDSEQSQRSIDHYLFLPIFEELVKTEYNNYIMQRLVVASIELIKVNKFGVLPCQKYVFELIYEVIRNITMAKQYLDWSEILFILFVEQVQQETYYVSMMDFLRIILNKYTFMYYTTKEKSKEHSNMMHSEGRYSSEKSLKSISKLIYACSILVDRSNSFQEQVVREVIDFWCKEDIYELQLQFMKFINNCIENHIQLRQFLFTNSQNMDVIVHLCNRSYSKPEQLQAGVRLTCYLMTYLGNLPRQDRQSLMIDHNTNLTQLKSRLEDYMASVSISNGELLKMIEGNLYELTRMLEESDLI